jgi:hypothetical protein
MRRKYKVGQYNTKSVNKNQDESGENRRKGENEMGVKDFFN